MSVRLSAVIPVHDEAEAVAATVRNLTVELGRSGIVQAEIVVADDGSADGSGAAARAAATSVPVNVVRLDLNGGRFAARSAGLAAAEGEYVLFVDAGVTLVPGALAFLEAQLAEGRRVWNAHTEIVADGSPYGLFWRAVDHLAFGVYFDDPRPTSFGPEDFDRFPKGTTCFCAPRALLVDAFADFRTRYADTRHANDDTPIIRAVAAHERINIAPEFACRYVPRDALAPFLRHAFHRGIVFLDGHGRRESRFFPVVAAFYPFSLLAAAAVVRRPGVAVALAAACAGGAAAAAAARGRPLGEIAAFSGLAPPYAVAHGAGMWKGLLLAASARRASP